MSRVTDPGGVLRALGLCVVLVGCLSSTGGEPPDPADDPPGLRVLFIGNSLTYWNDMPLMLRAMLEDADVPVGRIEAVVFGNFGLEDHWVSGPARERIAEGDFDVVAIQQGPSATEGRPSLLEYSQRFAEEIRAAGGEPALYMVWPAEVRDFDFDGVSDSYATAAALVDGLLFPAGEAWRAAWRIDPSAELYGPDGFHPTLAGSYLAALVMFEQLANRPASDAPGFMTLPSAVVDFTDEELAVMYQAASEANEAFAR